MNDTTRLTALVHGQVQGVGYRFFVERQAKEPGLSGYTRNLRDGAVEVVVEGPRAGLEKLVVQLRQGPRMARVERVETTWAEATGEFSGFRISG